MESAGVTQLRMGIRLDSNFLAVPPTNICHIVMLEIGSFKHVVRHLFLPWDREDVYVCG